MMYEGGVVDIRSSTKVDYYLSYNEKFKTIFLINRIASANFIYVKATFLTCH